MYLYDIEGYFNDNKFNFKINKFSVINYEENGYVECDCGTCISKNPLEDLDKFQIGLLDNKQPEISIMTTNKNKIEEYKSEIIRKIKSTLQRRKSLIELQLQILENNSEKKKVKKQIDYKKAYDVLKEIYGKLGYYID